MYLFSSNGVHVLIYSVYVLITSQRCPIPSNNDQNYTAQVFQMKLIHLYCKFGVNVTTIWQMISQKNTPGALKSRGKFLFFFLQHPLSDNNYTAWIKRRPLREGRERENLAREKRGLFTRANREFKQSTTATAMLSSKNKRFLMSRTMAVHARYKLLFISLSSSASRQPQIIYFSVFWRTQTPAANLSYFHLELNAGVPYLTWASAGTDTHTKKVQTTAKCERKKWVLFSLVVVLGVIVAS